MDTPIISQKYIKTLSNRQRAERKAKYYDKIIARGIKLEKKQKVKLKFF